MTPIAFAGGVTNVSLDLHCVVRLQTPPNTALCNITGTTPGHYINPTAATSTPGKLTLTSSNTLTITNSSDTSCTSAGVPTGAARFVDLSEQTITLTSVAESPIVTSP